MTKKKDKIGFGRLVKQAGKGLGRTIKKGGLGLSRSVKGVGRIEASLLKNATKHKRRK